jgi:predicted dehydrogenase
MRSFLVSRYRVGIIGLGRIASTIDDEVQGHARVMLPYSHMACYREVPLVEVVAGADPFDEQREAFGERWGMDKGSLYADFREMLAREQLDIVTVATSAKPRPEIVRACAEAGVKAIFAEKPLAISLSDADDMVALCREKGVVLAVGCTRRWDAWWQMARKLIANGELGQLLQINAMGNCGISHNGSHMIDLIRFLAGDEIEWVFGEGESDEAATSDDDLRMNGYLAFKNGARCYIRTWPSGPSDWSFEIVGDKGTLRSMANGSEMEWITRIDRDVIATRGMPRPQRINSPGVNAVYDIVNCIETGKKPECSGEDGVAALETALALRESHRRGGCRVNVPLEDRSLSIRSMETLRGDLPVALQRRNA